MPRLQVRLSGIAPDLPDDLVPDDAWHLAENMAPESGVMRFRWPFGQELLGVPGIAALRPRWSHSLIAEGPAPISMIGGQWAQVGVNASNEARLEVVRPVESVDKTPSGWTAETADPYTVTGGMLNGVLLVNTPRQPPAVLQLSPPYASSSDYASQVLTGAAPLLPAGTRFRAMRPWQYQAVGIENRYTLRWSASVPPGGLPIEWEPAATNDAGDLELAGGQDRLLVDLGAAGRDLIVYGDRSTHVLSYVGPPQVVSARTLLQTSGLLAVNCWTNWRGGHVVWSGDDALLVTPAGAESIADAVTRRTLRDQAEIAAAAFPDGINAAAFVTWDPLRAQVLFVPPADPLSTPSEALTWEPATGKWGRRTLGPVYHARAGRVLMSAPFVNDLRLVAAGADTSLPRNGGLMVDGLPRSGQEPQGWQLERRELDAGDSKLRKFVTRILPRVEAPSGVEVSVQVGVRDAPSGAYDWTAPQLVDPEARPWAYVEREGRFIAVRLSGEVSAAQLGPVSVAGFDIEYQPGGLY